MLLRVPSLSRQRTFFRVTTLCSILVIIIVGSALHTWKYDASIDMRRDIFRAVSKTSTTVLPSSRLQLHRRDYAYVLNKVDICMAGHEVPVFIAVISSPKNFDRRRVIRGTWGRQSLQHGFKIAFFLGRPSQENLERNVLAEDASHRDIIQGDFADNYRNLSVKSVIMVRWISKFCPNASFLLKIDDDVLLSVWDLAATVKERRGTNRTIWGYRYTGGMPHRTNTSKWYVPESVFPLKKYPDFVAGPSYLMTGDSAPLLAEFCVTVPYLHLEDVFLTGLVAEKARVQRLSDSGLCNYRKKLIPCIRPRMITSHGYNPADLNISWSTMVRSVTKRRCDTELSPHAQKIFNSTAWK